MLPLSIFFFFFTHLTSPHFTRSLVITLHSEVIKHHQTHTWQSSPYLRWATALHHWESGDFLHCLLLIAALWRHGAVAMVTFQSKWRYMFMFLGIQLVVMALLSREGYQKRVNYFIRIFRKANTTAVTGRNHTAAGVTGGDVYANLSHQPRTPSHGEEMAYCPKISPLIGEWPLLLLSFHHIPQCATENISLLTIDLKSQHWYSFPWLSHGTLSVVISLIYSTVEEFHCVTGVLGVGYGGWVTWTNFFFFVLCLRLDVYWIYFLATDPLNRNLEFHWRWFNKGILTGIVELSVRRSVWAERVIVTQQHTTKAAQIRLSMIHTPGNIILIIIMIII